MQIVIDIPEETYEYWKEHSYEYVFAQAIKDGVVLPKGHGRLIDADVFEKRLMDARSYYIGEKADDFDLRFAAGLKSAAERLVDAPTIIEADTTESEDRCKNCEYSHNPDYTRCHECKAESEDNT